MVSVGGRGVGVGGKSVGLGGTDLVVGGKGIGGGIRAGAEMGVSVGGASFIVKEAIVAVDGRVREVGSAPLQLTVRVRNITVVTITL